MVIQIAIAKTAKINTLTVVFSLSDISILTFFYDTQHLLLNDANKIKF